MFSIFTHVMKPVRDTNSESGLPVVLSQEKRDLTVLLTKFAFIFTFEDFLVFIESNPFINVLSICLVLLAGITEENSTVQRDILH